MVVAVVVAGTVVGGTVVAGIVVAGSVVDAMVVAASARRISRRRRGLGDLGDVGDRARTGFVCRRQLRLLVRGQGGGDDHEPDHAGGCPTPHREHREPARPPARPRHHGHVGPDDGGGSALGDPSSPCSSRSWAGRRLSDHLNHGADPAPDLADDLDGSLSDVGYRDRVTSAPERVLSEEWDSRNVCWWCRSTAWRRASSRPTRCPTCVRSPARADRASRLARSCRRSRCRPTPRCSAAIDPEVHGLVDNTPIPPAGDAPSFLAAARAAGRTTASRAVLAPARPVVEAEGGDATG